MKVCHVVRRYGPVGGMESYVFHLTRALADLRIDIVIVCEEDLSEAGHPPNLKVHAIGVAPMRRPRWRAMEWFRGRVEPEVVRLKRDGYLIHSHERIRGHHITTQHGPLMTGQVSSLAVFFSQRLRSWLRFEREELNCSLILPVSRMVGRYINQAFSEASIGPIVWPAMQTSTDIIPPSTLTQKNQIIFVGREVKRKGLDRAISLVEKMRESMPQVELHVFGVAANNVSAKYRKPFVRFFGWVDAIPYHHYRVLLHPARIEPFGMCVAEALANGLSCFVSSNTGALDLRLYDPGLKIYDLDQTTDVENIESLKKELCDFNNRRGATVRRTIPWSWDELARFHVNDIYPIITGSNC